jgi:hypothetical protein
MEAKTPRDFLEVEAKIAFKPMWCCLLMSQAEYITQIKYEASISKWLLQLPHKIVPFWSSLLIAYELEEDSSRHAGIQLLLLVVAF